MKLYLPDVFVEKLIAYAQKTPYFHLEGYMERFWVFKKRPYLPFASRIHHILRSDSDAHLHDHPWYYFTIILRGGYWEVTFAEPWENYGTKYEVFLGDDGNWYKKRWYGAGSILFRKPNTWHRLIVEEGETAWTWFTTSKKVQDWGFKTKKGKIHWKNYLKDTLFNGKGERDVKEEYAHP
jgi:hypothetical protein